MTRVGIHWSPEGGTAQTRKVAAVLDGLFVMLGGNHRLADVLDWPAATVIVRLPTPHPQTEPMQYLADVAGIVAEWQQRAGVIFQMGNEPEYEDGIDVTAAWDIEAWIAAAPGFAAALRSAFPGILLGSAPFLVTNTQFMTPAYLAAFDAICVHCYWQQNHREDIRNPNLGGTWRYASRLAAGDPVYVTEVNSAPPDDGIPGQSYTDPAQIAEWFGTLDQAITGAALFVADGRGPWARHNVSVPNATAVLKAISTPVPVPVPTSSLAFDGDVPLDVWDAMMSDGAKADILNGTLFRRVSPFAGDGMRKIVMAAAREVDVSPRLMAAWTASENAQATDISPSLLAIMNGAGIKYVGQSRAYRSNVFPPPNESGVYAGFNSWGDFWYTLAVNIKTILPDAWIAGDLGSIASYYTTGDPNAGGGQAKVVFYRQYSDRTRYPASGSPPVPVPLPWYVTGVTGRQIIDLARTFIGIPNSDGRDGQPAPNTYHPWAYWCEAFAELIPRLLGIDPGRLPSALAHGMALAAAGLLHTTGTPVHGAWVIFGSSFDPNGHIGFWDADVGMLLGTLTDGTGIGYRAWGMDTPGIMGWAIPPGMVQEGDEDMAIPTLVAMDWGEVEIVWSALGAAWNPDAGIFRDWLDKVYRQNMRGIGVPVGGERGFDDGARVVQPFSSGLLAQWTKGDDTVRWLGVLPEGDPPAAVASPTPAPLPKPKNGKAA
jgi:hypothetical protein